MTVNELIRALSSFDPDWKVIMPGEQEDFCEVHGVFADLVRFHHMRVGLTDEREVDRTDIVRLFGRDSG